jgi:beta-glucosidase
LFLTQILHEEFKMGVPMASTASSYGGSKPSARHFSFTIFGTCFTDKICPQCKISHTILDKKSIEILISSIFGGDPCDKLQASMKKKFPLPQNRFQFPKNFVWGTATASAQIEGAAFEDGKTETIWDRFSREPGRVKNGENLDVACDHYHKFRADFKLMKSLGIKNYRFSFAWARLFPENNQIPNPKGVRFYRNLIEAMLENGITPWATMYHWDLPQYFQDQGGWLTRKMPEAFALYANFLVQTFGDLVKNWFVLNEISCFISGSYLSTGIQAPGFSKSQAEVNQGLHHAVMAHGYGVRAVREFGRKGSRVGMAENSHIFIPVQEDEESIDAAREIYQIRNSSMLGAMLRGGYDGYYEKLVPKAKDRAKVQKGDFALMGEPVDFVGINLYAGEFVEKNEKGKAVTIPFPKSYPTADSPWLRISPRTLYWGPRFAQECYGAKEIYITENGFGYDDPDEVAGTFKDTHRKEYYRLYLEQAHRAIQDGVPLKGYFAWSFMDNFEWQDGYSRRFGMIHTDFKTLKRTPKLSALWYAKVIEKNGLL